METHGMIFVLFGFFLSWFWFWKKVQGVGSITILQGERRCGRNAVFTTALIGDDMPIP